MKGSHVLHRRESCTIFGMQENATSIKIKIIKLTQQQKECVTLSSRSLACYVCVLHLHCSTRTSSRSTR